MTVASAEKKRSKFNFEKETGRKLGIN